MPLNRDEPVFDHLTKKERELLRIPKPMTEVEPPKRKEQEAIKERVKRGGAEWE